MTDVERVAQRLHHARVVRHDDFLPPTIDGRKPILRLAARIYDLRQRGYKIRDERTESGMVDYFLVARPAGAEVASRPTYPPRSTGGAPPEPPVSLFPADTTSPGSVGRDTATDEMPRRGPSSHDPFSEAA